MQELKFDTIVLGGGPAGMSAGMYAARGAVSTAIVENVPDTYDPGDQDAIDKLLTKYENRIVNEPVEHAYVLLKGKVYHAIGHDENVNFGRVMELGPSSLEGAIVIHNHPPSEYATSNLSHFDVTELFAQKLKTIIGCDLEYRYWVTNNKQAKLPDGYSFEMVWKSKRNDLVIESLIAGVENKNLDYDAIIQACEEVGLKHERSSRS